MSNTKKTAKDAKPGDRIWVKNSVGKIHEWKIISPELYTGSQPLDAIWGFLADDEAVIGGVMIKPFSVDGSWEIGGRVLWPHDILNEDTWLTPMMCGLNLSDADKSAIQDHVRKHSAPAIVPTKRTAADAQNGDKAWVLDRRSGEIIVGRIQNLQTPEYLEIRVGRRTSDVFARYFEQFGETWGFPEDRPDAPKEILADQPEPHEERPLPPQIGNVALLIKVKGKDWVKVNCPKAWEAYKAADLKKVQEAYEQMTKPGPLAGKIPNLH